MKPSRLGLFVCSLLTLFVPAWAQQREDYPSLATPQVHSAKLSAPEHLQNYIAEGKLRLGLREAILLTLENNSQVRIQETQVETSKFSLLGAHKAFDPLLNALYNVNSLSSAPFSQLQGTGSASTFISTTQNALFTYTETFVTGTNIQLGLNSNNNYSNNSFFLYNPYITSVVNFQLIQPLLKNGGLFANQAPLIIARRNLEQSRANFIGQVNNNVLQAVGQYWAVVQARGNLDVARSSMAAAEATYKHDKRALELGALPPLDIYRSESQVASRRVQVIQSEYALKQAEDALRMTIGADQDPKFQALDLELTEKPEPEGEMRAIDTATALQQALTERPELEASRSALAGDEASIRLAHNHLLPQLDLTASYASNGLGGTQFNELGQKITSSSINQLFGFTYPTYYAQLSLTLPLKNRAAQADMGTALVTRRNDLYTERQRREQILLDVTTAVHQLEQAKLSIAAGKESLDLAQKTLAAEQRKYELGSETIFFVLEAQTELANAELALLQAQVNYQLAVANVDHATGGLLEPYHLQIAELTK